MAGSATGGTRIVAASLALMLLAACAGPLEDNKVTSLPPPPGLKEDLPAPEPGRLAKAKEFFIQGKNKEADRLVSEELRSDPSSSLAWHYRALLLAAKDEPAQALAALDMAILDEGQRGALTFRQRAEALGKEGKRPEAREVYETGLQRHPNDPGLLHGLALSLLQEGGDLGRAEDLAARAVAGQPRQASHWETLGRIQRARGKDKAAVVSFHRWLLLDPDSKEAQTLVMQGILRLSPEEVSRLTPSR